MGNTYKLYASYSKTLPKGVEYSLIPYGGKYILCYTDKEMPESFKVIPDNTQLTRQEMDWLMQTKLIINSNAIKEQSTEVTEMFVDFLNVFEKELKKEKRKVNKNKPKMEN